MGCWLPIMQRRMQLRIRKRSRPWRPGAAASSPRGKGRRPTAAAQRRRGSIVVAAHDGDPGTGAAGGGATHGMHQAPAMQRVVFVCLVAGYRYLVYMRRS
eukprot:COSAG01_NODE_925_length_12707_cov_21.250297_9_plen_100_part_00